MTENFKENLWGEGWRRTTSHNQAFNFRGYLLKAWTTPRVSSVSSWMPDGICGATGLFSDVQSTVSQVGQITGHPGQVEVVRWRCPVCISSWNWNLEERLFMAQNVEVFSIKVVMETLIMRVFANLPSPGRENTGTRTELWEIWTSRDGEGKWWSVKRKPQCEVREDKKGVNLKKVL